MFKYVLPSLGAMLLVVVYQGCSTPVNEVYNVGSSISKFCTLPAGVSGSPQTIEEAVALINALPKPVTVSCFLSSLNRPLKVSASSSIFSAQPAAGARSPRIFIMSGNLFISVVPEGAGSKVVEFSFLTATDTSIKAEIAFPVLQNLSWSAPYERVRSSSGTSCAGCHSNEVQAAGVTWAEAFASRALQPKAENVVPLQNIRNEFNVCDAKAEPQRCQILRALFDFGDVQSQSFPAGMPFSIF